MVEDNHQISILRFGGRTKSNNEISMSLVEEHGCHKFTRNILRQRKITVKVSDVVSLHECK